MHTRMINPKDYNPLQISRSVIVGYTELSGRVPFSVWVLKES